MPKSEEEADEEIQEDEADIVNASEKVNQGDEVEIQDRKGRRLKIKIKKISPEEAVDDSEEYS